MKPYHDPGRRRALKLGAAGLLAVAGCDLEEVFTPEDPGTPAPPVATDLPGATPSQLRAQCIQEGIAALKAECQRNAGGDWARWLKDLEGFRTALKAKIEAGTANAPNAPGHLEGRKPVLEACGDPPLFESIPAGYLRYIFEPHSIDKFRRTQPVVAVSRWLQRQGIDLIFVPVPKMSEVYASRVAQPCPESGIVAPQVRRLLLELLENDMEVVDLLPLFLAAEDKDKRPLYQPDDPHWGPRGWEIAARVIAQRLRRYPLLRQAQEGPPLFTRVETPFPFLGAAHPALTPEQQRRVEGIRMKSRPVARPVAKDIRLVSTHSPVLLIGDSYSGGFRDLLALGLNQPLAIHTNGGQTTEAIKEAVRNPRLLKRRLVVIWVICNSSLARPRWDLPPAVTTGTRL